MTSAPPPVTGPGTAGDDDAARWREAARIRSEHPGWIVLWLAHLGQYRAYPLVQGRRRAIVTAPAPDELAAQITRAEQASPQPPRRSAAGKAGRP
jgi:hypothetical protein